MVKIVKSNKPFEEDYEQLLGDARDIHRRTGCTVTVLAVHPITGEPHEVVVDGTDDRNNDVPAPDHFTAPNVRRYLRLKGRLGDTTLRVLSSELGGSMTLPEVEKLMFRVRAVRLAMLRRSKAAPAGGGRGPPEQGLKLASHLVALGSSIVNRREEKTITLTMFG
uniref:Uncharacterized protein n=1 Tax=Oryza brachyantha TaxID=4533 RepID=J3MPU8_ORYBR